MTKKRAKLEECKTYAEIEWYINHTNGKTGDTEGSHTKIYGPNGTTVMPRCNHTNEQMPKGTLHTLFRQLNKIGIF